MKKILTTVLSIGLLSVFANDMSKEEKKEINEIAKNAIEIIGGGLKKELQKNMKEGGAKQAAVFCSHQASELLGELSKKLPEGVSVRRITNKPRNENNMAKNEIEQTVLNELEKEDRKKHPLIKKLSNTHYQVYKPIRIQDKCLTCHGNEETRNKEAYNEIAKIYPKDKAIGYNEGEFRGVFLVDILKK